MKVDRIGQLARVSEILKNRANLPWETFRWRHAGCKVEVKDLPPTNSSEIDPATGDPRPILSQQLHCVDHDALSRVQKSVGQ